MLQSTNNSRLQIDDAMHVTRFMIVKHVNLVADYHQTQCCSLFLYREYIPSIKMGGKKLRFPWYWGECPPTARPALR